ncbi:MAG: hypothetical protein JOY81_11330 [Alphaproteobacteria bacterium]|nr:hypothetical protein [Alphaproteobacteria bacterium]
MNSEGTGSQPLARDVRWPLPAEHDQQTCQQSYKPSDEQPSGDDLPAFPIEPPISWPRVFPGL